MAVKSKSIISQLRNLYPDEAWRSVRNGFGGWSYETESGWIAGWRSCLGPRYDGDDDSFESRFYVYKTTEVKQLFFGLDGAFEL